ncbi:hypothetical protein [Mangrovicoccus sp. HB161399]|uniref:hypothetical protein n=1 Tax=Mangrovicoccus sp. HB161399 TaxID=2720392 RepID=UPI0015540876|nr:hypothetical protein [Mangrovicoccus sp. HB161399]
MKMRTQAELVAQVSGISELVLVRSDPPALFVRASGRVPTSGRGNAVLVARIHAVPPADGIQDFDFLADPPHDAVLQVETELSGECLLHGLPGWAKGVRVTAARNQIVHLFPERAAAIAGEVPEPAAVPAMPSHAMPPHLHGPAEPLLVESFEGFALEDGPQGRSMDFLLAAMSFPEAQSRPEMRGIAADPVSGRCLLTAEVPVLYRRTVRRRLLARVHCGPGAELREAVRSGIEGAVRAGTALGVLAGGDLATGAAALQARLKTGLALAFGCDFPEIHVELRREAVPGPWKRL